MENTNNSSRVPKLRFPGFDGEWGEKKLGEITEDVYQPQTISKDFFSKKGYPVYGANGIIGYYDKYNHETDQILVTCRGSSCGTINLSKGKCWITGNAMVVNLDKVEEQYDKYFFYYMLENADLGHLITGSGQPQIVRTPLLNLTLFLPPTFEEQHKIASFLSEMDNQISAQSQKVESLKTHKRGLMQQLFPQPGETTPQLRFPGFTGKWEEKKLGGILIERKESSIITEELPQLSFTIAEGVIRPEDRKTNQRDFLMTDKDNKRFSVTRLHDIIYNPANVVYGAIHKNNLCDGVVSPIYKIFWTKENADFINYLLRRPEFISLLASRAEGTVTKLKTLKADAFLDMTVPFIVDPVEQKKIAECLSELDKNIEAELAKLESLKNHKKGLMQQLFPEPIK